MQAAPLLTCASYLFILKDESGNKKAAILHHANGSILQPDILENIVRQINEEKIHLENVDIKVAISKSEKVTLSILEENTGLLKEFGFNISSISTIDHADVYSVDSRGNDGIIIPTDPQEKKGPSLKSKDNDGCTIG